MSMLDTAQCERLVRFARLMVPGGQGMPSAEAIGLCGDPVDEVLAIDPTRMEGLGRILALPGEIGTMADIEALAQRDASGFADLGVVLANAYFMHADVRAAIGYPGQEARDSSAGLTNADHALLEPVITRGSIFRPTPA
ncbi:MAG: hypothetical protein JJ920_07220 [Roseitalea sp.]|jgi:hypothetical protein|nr:hypothetical protein [Roseitalea sp.]MBO6720324.1 hypothetical protein [Roseitalea sp.]MBO6742684.1 hypothetical protein [Roseitalea sp.]